jgi:hypothetical protein
MAQELARSQQPANVLSPVQRRENAMSILRIEATSSSIAAKAATALTGQWPHVKPDNPEAWIQAIADVFEGYPPGVVAECINPKTGLFRTREYAPTGAAVVEWCDKRLEYHRKWAAYVPIKRTVQPEKEFSDDHRKTMIERWQAWAHEMFGKLKRFDTVRQ